MPDAVRCMVLGMFRCLLTVFVCPVSRSSSAQAIYRSSTGPSSRPSWVVRPQRQPSQPPRRSSGRGRECCTPLPTLSALEEFKCKTRYIHFRNFRVRKRKRFLALCYEMKVVWRLARLAKERRFRMLFSVGESAFWQKRSAPLNSTDIALSDDTKISIFQIWRIARFASKFFTCSVLPISLCLKYSPSRCIVCQFTVTSTNAFFFLNK